MYRKRYYRRRAKRGKRAGRVVRKRSTRSVKKARVTKFKKGRVSANWMVSRANISNANLAHATLSGHNVISAIITQGTGQFLTINRRYIDISEVKITLHLYNKNGRRAHFRWALVSPKYRNANNVTDVSDDFFLNRTVDDQNGVAFSASTGANMLTDPLYKARMRIYGQGSRTLGTSLNSGGDQNSIFTPGSNNVQVVINKYAVNKRFWVENTNPTGAQMPLWFMFWWNSDLYNTDTSEMFPVAVNALIETTVRKSP